jgi:DNA-binding beta-propeller fold protein YncE
MMKLKRPKRRTVKTEASTAQNDSSLRANEVSEAISAHRSGIYIRDKTGHDKSCPNIKDNRSGSVKLGRTLSRTSIQTLIRYISPLLTCLLLIPSSALAASEAFVVNNLAETLSRIDLENGSVQNHITVLGTTPNQVSYSNDYLYVLNSISADLQKIDPGSHSIVSDIPLPIGSNPYNMALEDQHAYVSCLVSGAVERIDLSTNQISGQVSIGGYPEGVTIFDNRLYVAQTGFNPSDFSYGQGRIAVIDLFGFTLAREINVGKNPQAIIVAPDGKLHVVCTGNYADISGAIYIFNPVSQTVEDSIMIGGQPANGIINQDGICFLAAGGWADHGHIYSYNVTTREIIHGPLNPIQAGLGVTALALDSLGFIYSCDFGSDTVTKLNSSGQIAATYNVGDGPQSIVILDDRFTYIEDIADPIRPGRPAILGNYPNPFNPETLIKYQLPDGSKGISIAIYDLEGKIIRRLNLGTAGDPGEVVWNGKGDNGLACSSGIYFACLEGGYYVSKRLSGAAIKLLLIR